MNASCCVVGTKLCQNYNSMEGILKETKTSPVTAKWTKEDLNLGSEVNRW